MIGELFPKPYSACSSALFMFAISNTNMPWPIHCWVYSIGNFDVKHTEYRSTGRSMTVFNALFVGRKFQKV
jgi:hypothetical protein